MNNSVTGNKSDRNHSTVKDAVATIVIVAECIALIIFLCLLAGNLNTNHRNDIHTAEQLLRTAEREDYGTLFEYVAQNRVQGENGAQYNEVYAIADYYYGGVRYKGAMASGDDKKAKEYYERMQENKNAMGELGYIAEKIDIRLKMQ